MTDGVAPEAVAAATACESLHVSALFAEWTPLVLDAAGVGVGAGNRVADVACGTGILARSALSRVGTSGVVVGVDPDAGMLAVAAEVEPAVDWRRGRRSFPQPSTTGSIRRLVAHVIRHAPEALP